MRFSTLFWDFDGTLFDTYPPLIGSIERALGEYNVVVPRKTITQLLRSTLSNTIAALAIANGLRPDELESRVLHQHAQTSVRDNRPFPGAIRTLERVLAAGGRNYLITHRDADSLWAILNWYRVDGLFTDLITSDDGFARKPDPQSFIAMIERHNLSRADILAIGDRDLDILVGRSARVHTCLYNALPSSGVLPDFMISAFAELEVILRIGA